MPYSPNQSDGARWSSLRRDAWENCNCKYALYCLSEIYVHASAQGFPKRQALWSCQQQLHDSKTNETSHPWRRKINWSASDFNANQFIRAHSRHLVPASRCLTVLQPTKQTNYWMCCRDFSLDVYNMSWPLEMHNASLTRGREWTRARYHTNGTSLFRLEGYATPKFPTYQSWVLYDEMDRFVATQTHKIQCFDLNNDTRSGPKSFPTISSQ